MISEDVMLKRFYTQNPDYIRKEIEIVNNGDGYTVNLKKKNGKKKSGYAHIKMRMSKIVYTDMLVVVLMNQGRILIVKREN